MTRRAFLLLILSWLAIVPPAASAWASDGDGDSGGSNSGSGSGSSGSGSSGSGSSGGGDDDSGGSNSGSGSGNSGSGSEGGDDDDDDSGGNSGSGSSGSGKKSEQDRARNAVAAGRAMPLEEALKRLRERYSGRVIDVDLRSEGKRLVYRFKVKSGGGVVRKVTMDAATGQIRGFFGY